MATKDIELIVKPSTPHFVGDGFRVMTLIPSGSGLSMQRMNPFIMMDYNPKFHFPPSNTPKGVGVHPHRGFETVTIAYKGKVAHHDSSGGGGVISEGDVQWMTAASGVLHKEYHEEEFSKTGGEFQMVQLWVNLPAKYKMSEPKYQAIAKDSISKVELPANSGQVEIIAGSYEGTAGAASTFTPIHLLNTRLKSGGTASFSFPENFNTGLLVLEGNVKINATQVVGADHFALFENKGEDFQVTATDDTVFLILSGEPIHEPIASHGPFVMNSKEELMQAFQDFNEGKFGYLS